MGQLKRLDCGCITACIELWADPLYWVGFDKIPAHQLIASRIVHDHRKVAWLTLALHRFGIPLEQLIRADHAPLQSQVADFCTARQPMDEVVVTTLSVLHNLCFDLQAANLSKCCLGDTLDHHIETAVGMSLLRFELRI